MTIFGSRDIFLLIMADLTERQIAILKALIDEYIETAQPISSDTLEKKYNLGVSPATIRNEMVQLSKQGYLKKTHTSSGRLPTSIGLKFYVRNLLKPKEISVADEVAVKEKIWDYREEVNRLIHQATIELARRTDALAIAIDTDNQFCWAGVANILDFPEFWDIDLTHSLLSLLDESSFWENLVSRVSEDAPVHVLLGDDFGVDYLEPCGFIFSRLNIGSKKNSIIGVIGPGRFAYGRIIPIVNYFSRLIEEISST